LEHSYLLKLCVSAASLLIVAYVVPGFKVGSFLSALVTAFFIGLANAFVWPVLIFLTLPLNLLTLGLFTFVVNGMVLKICAFFLPNFDVKTWGAAILGSVLLSIVTSLLQHLLS
jgi:putative membrane protein